MSYIKVAIGLIVNKNMVYITKGKYKKNIWEFPGGKAEKNENIIQALKRELLEEVGIIILKFRFFKYIKYFYSKKKLKLYFFLINQWKGRPYSREGYFYRWTFFYDLKTSDFPPANYSVITSLKKTLFCSNIFYKNYSDIFY
ncbi:8-oxo-dGTP diphosphatase MutT [Buchnera aphidicola]|uniref:8-oxo-dGTP diphosphatase n=1 Tax=Buchnera aphidicola str. USDA (Myzus persicae) TaxID=1009856 RepID=W0P096_BUCMP|nr:8-oxo-dGTP diphosphatase MutT [Buchnera aphidicola]AHG60171.1 Mutt [Buchnera aphidicola str. USDA (Myzus persicae)]AHG60750.1 Mutt [Buchnera aphidicola str. W106 (Myzus persicae)]AHG61323.1 Mutt [Buchnera aphidicola str. G002 (Myzus persicae)]AHG61896.1 Mutt [Buchnera aphidicola str. F009 (Myzus persicae)]WAI03138.1 MAG: 8-oxo-dGTP diphosphatase MutT [Buchnera aphidicola (Myzus persicae)]